MNIRQILAEAIAEDLSSSLETLGESWNAAFDAGYNRSTSGPHSDVYIHKSGKGVNADAAHAHLQTAGYKRTAMDAKHRFYSNGTHGVVLTIGDGVTVKKASRSKHSVNESHIPGSVHNFHAATHGQAVHDSFEGVKGYKKFSHGPYHTGFHADAHSEHLADHHGEGGVHEHVQENGYEHTKTVKAHDGMVHHIYEKSSPYTTHTAVATVHKATNKVRTFTTNATQSRD